MVNMSNKEQLPVAIVRRQHDLSSWQRHEQSKQILRSAHSAVMQARKIDDLLEAEVVYRYGDEEGPQRPQVVELVKMALHRVIDSL